MSTLHTNIRIMSNQTIDTNQGHWLLSKMGKKVLRPGGKELTLKMLEALDITSDDEVLEFAPGIGFTANLVLKNKPLSYTGVELNEEAAANLRKKITGPNRRIVLGNAAEVPLEDGIVNKLYGEAMLTMHVDKRKSEIIQEAHRLLKKGGLYGIHELGLLPDELPAEFKKTIQRDLAMCIKVNARPLTQSEWVALLEKEGFKIKSISTNPMSLLETKRMIDDEGIFRAIKIGFNILRDSHAKSRILEMRSVFKKYAKEMNAISIVAEKI